MHNIAAAQGPLAASRPVIRGVHGDWRRRESRVSAAIMTLLPYSKLNK